MVHDIFLGLLLLLIAPFLGALLGPPIAEWFGSALLNHARGMRAFYPRLALAAKAYREASCGPVSFEITQYAHGLETTSMDDPIYREAQQRAALQRVEELDGAIELMRASYRK